MTSLISFDYTLKIVLMGTSLLGLVSGVLGGYAVLRKQSLLGDAISHAALPGIALIFLITHTKNPVLLLIGALLAGWIGSALVSLIVRNTLIKEDAALGIILSVFFGFGLVLLTAIQKLPTSNKAGLMTYLFGNAATLLQADVLLMLGIGSGLLMVVALLWKEFNGLCFDADYMRSLGFSTGALDALLTMLIVIAIVIGLQTVGVVLMSAMIIAPSSAARQWTDSLWVMVLLSGIFGAISGILGTLFSAAFPGVPTGPSIVLVVSLIVLISLLLAPNRGIVFNAVQDHRHRNQIRSHAMLFNLLLFSESATDPFYPHDIAALTAIGRGPARKALHELASKGLAVNPEGDRWAITQKGLDYARNYARDKDLHDPIST